jgi:hypothetical protein
VAQRLIDLGASLKIRCRWTNMAALHYAAFFDVAPVLNTLLKSTKVITELIINSYRKKKNWKTKIGKQKTRLKILPVLTREHYTSLLHWV